MNNAELRDEMETRFPWLKDPDADVNGADEIDGLVTWYQETVKAAAPDLPRVVVILEGGLVQDILSDQPVSVAVIDYDTDGADEGELTQIPQMRDGTPGGYEPASASIRSVDVSPERTRQLHQAINPDALTLTTAPAPKTFAEMCQEQAARDLAETPNAQKYIDAAREQTNDEVEIDDAPPLSPSPDSNGCWVAAWVWVSDSEAGIDEDDRAPIDVDNTTKTGPDGCFPAFS